MVLYILRQSTTTRTADLPNSFRLVRFDTRTANFPVQQTAGRQDLISNHLCGQSQPFRPSQVDIIRIFFQVFLFNDRRLFISGCTDQLFDQSLNVPAILLEVNRQPIQEFWVAWEIALISEISNRSHQSTSEDKCP